MTAGRGFEALKSNVSKSFLPRLFGVTRYYCWIDFKY
jgi:hypothetical protein